MSASTDSVESYLQEKLFGAKESVSTTLLSFERGQTLQEAVQSLQSFYNSHKDVLDASFKLVTREESKRLVEIISASDLDDTRRDIARIWIVSPHRADDKVIIAEMASKAQSLQLDLSIGRLKYLGLKTNPLLDDQFSFSSRTNSHPKPAEPPVPTKPIIKSEPVPLLEESSDKVTDKVPAAPQRPALPPATKKIKQENTANPPTNAVPSKKLKPNAQFFTKVSKDDALKAMHNRRPELVPVKEAVVISEDFPEENEPEIDTSSSNASRDKLLRELEEAMLQGDENDDEDGSQHSDEVDDHRSPEEEPAPYDSGADDVMEAVNSPSNPVKLENVEEPPLEPKDETPEEGEPGSQSRNWPETAPRAKSKRVRKIVVTQDEEGFDDQKEVWEDVPLTPTEEVIIEAPAIETSEAVSQPEQKPANVASNSMGEPDDSKVAKAPPKMASGSAPKKQKTLMSFFGKK